MTNFVVRVSDDSCTIAQKLPAEPYDDVIGVTLRTRLLVTITKSWVDNLTPELRREFGTLLVSMGGGLILDKGFTEVE